MASTYTPLGVELMATGENAGTWGTKTNTNLNIIEQISGGYKVQTLNTAGAGANTTALTEADGATGATVATRVIIFGAVSPETISGNKIVTFPVGESLTLKFTFEEWLEFVNLVTEANVIFETNSQVNTYSCGFCGSINSEIEFIEPQEEDYN